MAKPAAENRPIDHTPVVIFLLFFSASIAAAVFSGAEISYAAGNLYRVDDPFKTGEKYVKKRKPVENISEYLKLKYYDKKYNKNYYKSRYNEILDGDSYESSDNTADKPSDATDELIKRVKDRSEKIKNLFNKPGKKRKTKSKKENEFDLSGPEDGSYTAYPDGPFQNERNSITASGGSKSGAGPDVIKTDSVPSPQETASKISNLIETKKYDELQKTGDCGIILIIYKFENYSKGYNSCYNFDDYDKAALIETFSKISGAEKHPDFFLSILTDYKFKDHVKKAALEAVYNLKINDEKINTAIEKIFISGGGELKAGALKTFAEIDRKRYFKICIDELQNKGNSDDYKTIVVKSLSDKGDPGCEVCELVKGFLYDKKAGDDLISASIKALGDFKYEKAIPALINLIRYAGDRHAGEAENALVKYSAKAVKPLIDVLGEPLSGHRASDILARIGTDSVALLSQCFLSRYEYVKFYALRAIEYNGSDYSINAAVPYLYDDQESIRSLAATVLSKKKWLPKNIDEEIMLYIAGGNWEKLRKIGDPAINNLAGLIKRKNYDGVSKAAAELSKFGIEKYMPPLIKLIEEKNPEIEYNLIKAFASIGKPSAGELIKILKKEGYNDEYGRRVARYSFIEMKKACIAELIDEFIITGSLKILNLLSNELNREACEYLKNKIKCNRGGPADKIKLNNYIRLLHKFEAEKYYAVTYDGKNSNFYNYFYVFIFTLFLAALIGVIDSSPVRIRFCRYFILMLIFIS